MAKFYGNIGFVTVQETKPGVWEEVPVEKKYYGDVLKNMARHQSANQLNDHIQISDEISIIADPFVRENLTSIRYINYLGVNWSISNVDASNYPRLVLTLGGVYNGKDQA
jgi:hypothetical protein